MRNTQSLVKEMKNERICHTLYQGYYLKSKNKIKTLTQLLGIIELGIEKRQTVENTVIFSLL